MSLVSTVALVVWSLLEIAYGSSPLRRLLGSVVLLAGVAGLLVG